MMLRLEMRMMMMMKQGKLQLPHPELRLMKSNQAPLQTSQHHCQSVAAPDGALQLRQSSLTIQVPQTLTAPLPPAQPHPTPSESTTQPRKTSQKVFCEWGN